MKTVLHREVCKICCLCLHKNLLRYTSIVCALLFVQLVDTSIERNSNNICGSQAALKRKGMVVNEICAFAENVFNSSKYYSWPGGRRQGLGLADLHCNYVVVAAVTSDCERTVRRYQGASCTGVCVCVYSAAGPPGLGPAAAADRAGPRRGRPTQVRSAGGGEEEVSDGR